MSNTTLLNLVERRRALPVPSERRRLREAAKLSQDELGAHIGVSGPTICRYESGHDPRGVKLDRYAEALLDLQQAVSS
ncbi:MAG: helix-turn-helix transcriptional regulator [Acidimicrobiales bacterium]|jgi:predicted transcriptional regulator